MAIRTGDIDESKIRGGLFEIWPPTVVKSNLFCFNVTNIVCRKILKTMVPLEKTYSQTVNAVS